MQQGVFVRVFVASPSDVQEERTEACRVVHDWNAANSMSRSVLIEPVRVESHSQAVQGAHPQDLINGQLLDRCDLLVAIFWSRLGTPTNKDLSGTIQEIREFAESKGHDRVLLFFSTKSLPSSVDTEQLTALREFKQSIRDKGLYIEYESTSDFARLFRQQLDMAMNTILSSDEIAEVSPTQRQKITLSSESCTLLVSASHDEGGRITLSRTSFGHEVKAGRVCYSKGRDPRSEARWESAIEQLLSVGHIVDAGHKREVFRITKEGYDAADRLWYVLILREIEQLQSGENQYVGTEKLSAQKFLGQTISPAFVSEKVAEIHRLDAVEIVNSDQGIAACRLTDKGRKAIREHSWLEFAKSDVDSGEAT